MGFGNVLLVIGLSLCGVVVGAFAMAIFAVFSKKLADRVTEFLAKILSKIAAKLDVVFGDISDWFYGLATKLSGMY